MEARLVAGAFYRRFLRQTHHLLSSIWTPTLPQPLWLLSPIVFSFPILLPYCFRMSSPSFDALGRWTNYLRASLNCSIRSVSGTKSEDSFRAIAPCSWGSVRFSCAQGTWLHTHLELPWGTIYPCPRLPTSCLVRKWSYLPHPWLPSRGLWCRSPAEALQPSSSFLCLSIRLAFCIFWTPGSATFPSCSRDIHRVFHGLSGQFWVFHRRRLPC